MPRWLKIALKCCAVFVGLLLLLWMGLASYVYYNKKSLLQNITAQLNEDINGKLTIESMEPALLKGFPGISVSLKNVLLRDSLWYKHKHDLVRAKTLFVSIDVISALTGSTRIRNLTVENGNIYLFTDSNGISNTNLFKKATSKSSGKSGGFKSKINSVDLNNVQLTIENHLKRKRFNFAIDNFRGAIKYAGDEWNGEAKIRAVVQNFEFNTNKGSFMKDKALNADLEMNYNHIKHQLTLPAQQITIGDDDLDVKGQFMFADNSSDFELEVKATDILFSDAIAILTPAISSKLKEYVIKEPINAKAVIRGRLKNGGEPHIDVVADVKDNTVVFAGETLTNCTFTGRFNNENIKGQGFTDVNSAICLHDFEAKVFDIPFKSDSVQILNLKKPIFTGKFNADFPLARLNKTIGESFHFDGGNAKLDLLFKVPYNQNARGLRYIFGTIKVNSGSATYVPRNLKFNNASVTLNFKGHDLFLENMKVNTKSTSLKMQASLKDFSNLYYTDPGKLVVDWKVQSPQINLNEFLVFLAKRQNTPAKPGSFSKKLDQMLSEANMRLRLNVNRLIYKKFAATNVSSDIVLKQSGIAINNLSLNQGGGSLHIDGEIGQSGPVNSFKIVSSIRNVDVEKLFYAFDNFGQSGITDANLRGRFNGTTNMSGKIRDNGQIVPRSFHGSVAFDIKNGALVNFEPMRKVGAFAFPNRDFRNIEFVSLKNSLEIQGNKVVIPPMQIESSVLNIFVEGIYSLTTGTNLAIKIPLRNPKKDEAIFDKALKRERALKGIVINLRAIDGDDGKVKFKLGKRAPDGYGEEEGK